MKQLLKFSANWCSPCQALTTTIKSENDWGIDIKEIDIDEEIDMSARYGIRSVPTLVLIEDGREMKRKSGALSKAQLKEFING
jgi:thioredoxin-like negative regulator of GroEL